MKEEIDFNISNINIKNNISLDDNEKKLIDILGILMDGRNFEDEIVVSMRTLNEYLQFSEDEIIKVLRSMTKKIVEVSFNDGNEIYFASVFSKVSYNKDTKKVKFIFNTEAPEMLEKISEIYEHLAGFKSYNLKGKYSWKIYELLKRLDGEKSHYISLDYLKNILGVKDTYKLYADFKRKVIIYTQKEINEKTDISFEFEEIKKEKKIVGLEITVIKK